VRTRAAADRGPRLDPRSFKAILEALVEDLTVRWYSKHLVKQERAVLLRFFDHLRGAGIRDLRQVTEAHVTSYAAHLKDARTAKGTPYSVATVRTYVSAIQRLFRWLLARGGILQDPTLELVLPSWKRLPRALLNQAHARALVASPDPLTERGKRDRAVLELLYGTAIRVGECERLDLRDLDLVRGQVFVRTGKGRKDRVVPLVGRAADAVESYLRDARPELVKDPSERALFLTNRGGRLGVKRIQDLVRMNAKAAGITLRVTPHTLRHGCATHLLQRGADIRHVQKLLGHASVETTAIYTRVESQDLRKAIQRAHPRERRRTRKDRSSQ
jgi:integrase/recombinase XerD